MGTSTTSDILGGSVLATSRPNPLARPGIITSDRAPNGSMPAADQRRGGRQPVNTVVEIDYGEELVSAAAIQAALDSRGSVTLLPGVIELEAPIQLRSDQQLKGAGFATQLNYNGGGNYAVLMGEPGVSNSSCQLSSVRLNDAGVHIRSATFACNVARVWSFNASEAGLLIDSGQNSLGDGLTVDQVVVWDNALHGFVLRAYRSIGALTLRNITAQSNTGYGVWLETFDADAVVSNLHINFSTVQSNSSALYPYQLLMAGAFHDCKLHALFCEASTQTHAVTNIGVQAKTISGETCRPENLRIGESSYSNLNDLASGSHRHAVFSGAYRTVLEHFNITGASDVNVYWEGGAENDFKPQNNIPLLLPDNRIVSL